VLQGKKFDPDGAYVRRWVPELAPLRANFIHAPWETPPEVLARAGVELGTTYPRPIVDHRLARAEALAAYEQMKQLCG
jgi:deoxyribodipyrimidine photo-lyase